MKQGLPLTPKTTKGARRKRDTTKHDIVMLDVGRRRQALGESIRNHKVGAKRNETKNLEARLIPCLSFLVISVTFAVFSVVIQIAKFIALERRTNFEEDLESTVYSMVTRIYPSFFCFSSSSCVCVCVCVCVVCVSLPLPPPPPSQFPPPTPTPPPGLALFDSLAINLVSLSSSWACFLSFWLGMEPRSK
jgi:hypothetical protein